MAQDDRNYSRRGFLRRAAAGTSGLATGLASAAVPGCSPAPDPVSGLPRDKIRRLADVLLPSEVDAAERDAVVSGFLDWLRRYRADAEMDHGYGFTRERYTAPSPEPGYMQDLRDLDALVGGNLLDLSDDELRDFVAGAIELAAPQLDALPRRPDDSHLCIGLLSHYYRGAPATDRCYGVSIRREVCRGLFTDVDGLSPVETGDDA